MLPLASHLGDSAHDHVMLLVGQIAHQWWEIMTKYIFMTESMEVREEGAPHDPFPYKPSGT